MRSKPVVAVLGAVAIGASAIGLSVSSASSGNPADTAATTTPIKHVVVIFGENVSFDHYFGTYPTALNPPGEPAFHALPNTPSVNGLNTALLDANPNEFNPVRLDPSQALTCDQNHGYSAEQSADDLGLMDKFVQDTTGGGCTQSSSPDSGSYGPSGIVMDYYDGNTVTAMWNYAQHFVLNDNQYGSGFGPSTPGAIELISGNTSGATAENGTSSAVANGTDIGDQDPYYDLCSNPSSAANSGDISGTTIPQPNGVTMAMSGKNVGDLLNAKDLTWGWFQGGFTPSSYTASGTPVCGTAHANIGDASTPDYVQHHEPFQYYEDTSNPYHVSPASVSDVGVSDPAGTPYGQAVNHQYDISWFNQALAAGDLPSVSYLKAPAYEDAHPGYSDPLDEQRFVVDEINAIEQSPEWKSTAIFIDYDDSDGWYDHQLGPIIRQSEDTADSLSGPGKCGSGTTPPAQNDRCGVGPRLPLLVISPWAKQNYVDNTFTEQASILRFIEDNWGLDRIGNESADATAGTLANAFDFSQSYGHAPAIILNDTTGEIEKTIYPSGLTVAGGQPDTTTGTAGGTTAAGAGTSGAGSSTTGSTGSGPASGSGSTTSSGRTAPAAIRLPALSCSHAVAARAITLSCALKGGSSVTTLVRARLVHGKRVLASVAAVARHERVRLSLHLGAHRAAGRYTIRLTIDAGGSVAEKTASVRVR